MTDRYLTWRRVFNTDLRIPQWGEYDVARDGARTAGYEFFCWAGRVHHVDAAVGSDPVCQTDEVR